MRSVLLLLIFSLTITGTAGAQLVVNEILANEPGSATSLEWIELYNAGSAVSLGSYKLQIDGELISLPTDIELGRDQYFIVCRQLYATETSPGFESYWGDSSGVWGDTPEEAELYTPHEAGISLTNEAGSVQLTLGGFVIIDELGWTRSGLDGHSWERVSIEGDSVAQSVDPLGSTPGFVNSVTPIDYDLALTELTVKSIYGVTSLTFEIGNLGQAVYETSLLYLIRTGISPFDTVDVIEVETLEEGETISINRQYVFADEMYLSMRASLQEDDRDRNNTIEFTCPGENYPPLILSEFLANPTGGLNSEWVELKNRSDQVVDLSDWCAGDLLKVHSICEEPILLEPDSYVVLAQDTAAFLDYYTAFSGLCLEPGSWATLNNDADWVRLVDDFNIEADRFDYNLTYETNHTWCRTEEPLSLSRWGRSENTGGTPGEVNDVILWHQSSDLRVTVDPPYVSPDGDGFEDVTTISIEAPLADSYTVKIYDRQGRVVRSFYDKESMIPSEIEWDGLSDAGRRLPIGVYIVYVEAAGSGSIRETVVVAR